MWDVLATEAASAAGAKPTAPTDPTSSPKVTAKQRMALPVSRMINLHVRSAMTLTWTKPSGHI